MIKVCKATFDGNVFLPEEPVSIQPNTECIVFLSDIKIEEDIKRDIHPFSQVASPAFHQAFL